ncbi:class II aldolase/adducin family protein [Candidatus Bathyarchaeota archaeon]|jgi:L-ribulose-5-phosphate 4-epimerase|nr:class II aldolase/adducin family protein [Candidatus Bathyarchaeota archaeon]MBT4320681.1 class II aldolase/adducin family protein [Candidatus Bathyarchaeota archaeon]MBT4423735.1 class II aldolase/adducin family protein [Candidatus Bathyarchaeota archaeon]MBT5643008.1 class II aldolase/adducin family protein [Candidatus Bathyarchaeota archaeon]MBT6605593.1 class II aldolase/adducin family protein [Candidatus Bathyarchaeota archaeon]
MTDIEQQLRERLTVVGINLFDEGLTYGASGNISARVPGTDTCLIKPSGYRFCDLEPEHFLLVDINTMEVLKGNAKPSIETPFHTKLYQQWPEAGGVVHIHPEFSILLATLGKEIVMMGVDLYRAPALAKGIPLSKFAMPGTEKLADNMVDAMKEHVSCLMPHHGCTAIGKSIEEAAKNAKVVEALAELNYKILLVGEPSPLPQSMLDILVETAKNKGLLV